MNEKELLCRMALPLLPGIGLVGARHLIQAAGSATMLFEHARELLAALSFNEGKRYTDFNAATDRMAEYGLAALVGGMAAKKLGLLATLHEAMNRVADLSRLA